MIKLWNQTMPHRCVEDAFEPYLTPYDCDAAKTAIVVCPGGAYCGRADYEGNDVGAWLNTIGITAFVLEYRVAPSKAPAQPSDAQHGGVPGHCRVLPFEPGEPPIDRQLGAGVEVCAADQHGLGAG